MKQYKIILLGLFCLAMPLHADVKRESLHFVTTEAGIGYSALLNKSAIGTSSGLAGGKLQVGYEWRYRKLLVHTGLEFGMVNDMAKVTPFQMKTSYTVGLPEGQYMTEYFDFQSFKETQLMGQINLPIQAGAIFADRYYFLAGVRLGLPVVRSAQTKATVTTYLIDPSLIGELEDVPVHDAYTSTEKLSSTWTGFFNAQVSAEVGLVLNPFFEKPAKGKGKSSSSRNQKNKKKPILYRVGLFADYGINGCVKPYYQQGKADEPIAYVAQPREISLNSCLATAQTAAHSLLVGAKFAVLFQMNEPKPAKPLPSYFDIYIADLKTDEPIPASLSIYDKTKNRTYVKEAPKGKVRYRAKDGDYTFTASNEQYFPATQEASIAGEGVTETVRLALERKPEPVVVDTPIVSIPVKVGTKVVLHNLFFALNKTTVLPESEQALNELADFMNAHPGVTIRITGHTDNIGSDRANQILSDGRANAVRDELIKRGVAAERIEAEGKGESEPIADNDTEEGRAKNRRVEFTIIATGDELIEQEKE
ncbi:MAG: OmpA family protein [Paludibacteraceae bacterium]|nr:OmpA family protein [Paludibacteraceae bacterium]